MTASDTIATLEQLEQRVMTMLLAGNTEQMMRLRTQYENKVVVSRQLTGVGFFVDYEIPSHVPSLSCNPSFSFGDVTAVMRGLKHGVGFTLHVRKGRITTLEGYTYDEPWPDAVVIASISYAVIHGQQEILRYV